MANYVSSSPNVVSDSSGGYTAQLSEANSNFLFPSGRPAEIHTDLSLRNGEKVVVGTATLGNKGLILVLSARVIK